MYSDSEIIVDCLAELLETLLLQHEMDQTLHEGLGIVGSVMSGEAKSSLHSMGNSLNTVMIERRTMLHELVSAIGLQRFRFNERLAKGEFYECILKLKLRFFLVLNFIGIFNLLRRCWSMS